jgi:Domain of unknown function (DUF4390)
MRVPGVVPSRVRWAPGGLLLLAALSLVAPQTGRAELRISDLDVFLNDQEVTVHVVVLGAVPPAFVESIQSGVPARLRFTIELWQYNRLWRDRRLVMKVIERNLDYNVVTREYKVAALAGEGRAPYVTRELRDAQRVLSEVRGLKLTAATSFDPTDVFYVRVLAETALWGENTFLGRMAGTAEQTLRQSDYRTIMRVQ